MCVANASRRWKALESQDAGGALLKVSLLLIRSRKFGFLRC
jgi:hypothetical protein